MGWQDEPFVAFDTETTGFGTTARILEAGVVHFYQGAPVREWGTLFHPNGVDWEDGKVKEALAINRLSLEQLMGNPLFEDARLELLQELSEDVWVAHNISFDMRMLAQELARLGEDLPYKPSLLIDPMTLDFVLNRDQVSYKLQDVCSRWDVVQEDSHRAVADAKACGAVVARMMGDGRLPKELEDMRSFQAEANAQWRSKKPRR